MKTKTLQEKLSAYSVLGTAFLALAPHEVEAPLTYVDLPDHEICLRTTNRTKSFVTTSNGYYKTERIAETANSESNNPET
ncbi:MAG: hypothetical protein H6573_15275 [Lewinellaceae bacterium]|nr:hypothetical protein [Phaeodactylibacter sp.]MCB9348849.1 hypothetical protein [Lewinellaceae bacterium]